MILLTGATGVAGSFIANEFVRQREPVRILVRKGGPSFFSPGATRHPSAERRIIAQTQSTDLTYGTGDNY